MCIIAPEYGVGNFTKPALLFGVDDDGQPTVKAASMRSLKKYVKRKMSLGLNPNPSNDMSEEIRRTPSSLLITEEVERQQYDAEEEKQESSSGESSSDSDEEFNPDGYR